MATPAPDISDFKKGRVPRAVRARQLLDLAETLFVEHGFEGFSIEDLCRAAGVSRPVVYEHFGSKEGLYLACQRRIRDEFNIQLGEALSADDPARVVRDVAEFYYGALEADPQRWMLVFGRSAGFVGPMAEELYALREETIGALAAVVRALVPGLDDEAITVLAHQISGAGDGLGSWWLNNRDVPIERIVDYITSTVMAIADGMRARG